MSDYLQRCQEAADEQGITQLVNEINQRGQKATAAQSGGFTMAAYVEFSDDRYIYANSYGAAMYNAGGFHSDIVQFDEMQMPATIAAAVCGHIEAIDELLNATE
jgi:hypothetical protein